MLAVTVLPLPLKAALWRSALRRLRPFRRRLRPFSRLRPRLLLQNLLRCRRLCLLRPVRVGGQGR